MYFTYLAAAHFHKYLSKSRFQSMNPT